MTKYLFKRDNKSKIRVVSLDLNVHQCEDGDFYSITGESGLFGGKMTKRPLVTIDRGKVKRSVKEQAELQWNSLILSYLDKGYKTSDMLGIINISDNSEVESKVPQQNTDQSGNLKPQLAKHYKDVSNFNWNKTWYASYKYDGVRAMLFKKDNKIQTSSRGGKDYNVAATHIINDPRVIEIFNVHPDLILDGELYIHGKPLSYISGLCRLETLDEKHKELEFHCYDVVKEDIDFGKREILLNILKPNTPETSKIKFVEHHIISGKDNIMKLHQKAIEEGYEGLVLRDPLQSYKCGSRDRMFKIKEFTDGEFKILDIVDGLRDEDLCFLMETSEGNQFKAKPTGDRELKKWYREHIDELKGEMGTVKYFGFTTTDKPVPNLPVFLTVRNKKDINA